MPVSATWNYILEIHVHVLSNVYTPRSGRRAVKIYPELFLQGNFRLRVGRVFIGIILTPSQLRQSHTNVGHATLRLEHSMTISGGASTRGLVGLW